LLLGLAAACAPKDVDFEAIGTITRVDVNNAVGTFKPESLHDPREIARLVEIMNQDRQGWARQRPQTLGAPAQKCAYGIGFYDNDKWIGGVSIGSDGATVSRAQTQLGTLTAYKSDPEMVRAMLATLDKTLSRDKLSRFCATAQDMKSISVEELKGLRDSGVPFLLLDVREPSEFAAGAIAGAVNIPVNEVERRLNELPKDREIVVMCHSGRRSSRVTLALNGLGYQNAVNLTGGMAAWSQRIEPPR
jgi:rhodanese-related sulfurtransferase